MDEDGYDIRTVQEFLRHKDVSTTMIYTHVLNRGGRGVLSHLEKTSPLSTHMERALGLSWREERLKQRWDKGAVCSLIPSSS